MEPDRTPAPSETPVDTAERARLARRYRDPSQLNRAEYLLRVITRQVGWIRKEGLGRFVEEHELDPVKNTRAALQRALWRRRNPRRPGDARPVYLCGVTRSGTNMLVRGLSELPAVETHNEGDQPAFSRHRLVSDEIVLDLVGRSRHDVVLFKPLLDSHLLGHLLDLPTRVPGRGIWAYRDVDGRVGSSVSRFGPVELTALRELVAADGPTRWQGLGMTPQTRELLRTFDWDRMSPVDASALMWVVRNQLLFDEDLHARDDVLVLSYDKVIADPSLLRVACAHMGLPWQPSVSGEIDRRTSRRPRLDLDVRVRALCDDMIARLDEAADADIARLGALGGAAAPTSERGPDHLASRADR